MKNCKIKYFDVKNCELYLIRNAKEWYGKKFGRFKEINTFLI